jgi:hypothetical protein
MPSLHSPSSLAPLSIFAFFADFLLLETYATAKCTWKKSMTMFKFVERRVLTEFANRLSHEWWDHESTSTVVISFSVNHVPVHQNKHICRCYYRSRKANKSLTVKALSQTFWKATQSRVAIHCFNLKRKIWFSVVTAWNISINSTSWRFPSSSLVYSYSVNSGFNLTRT